jgi:hypothetical protein
LPPSPEKIKRQPAAKQTAEAKPGAKISNGNTLGLGLEARVTAHTWEVGLSALIQDFMPGEVVLLMDDPIPAGTPITVQVDTCSFDGQILFCTQSGSRWETHVSFDDVDSTGLRRTPRFPVLIPARVFLTSSELPIDGTIVDISGEGLGIELSQAVPRETNIAVQSQENTALGVVRHCRERAPGLFRVGVQLLHIIRKDPDLQKASAESGWMNKLGARFGRKERPKGWS